MTKRLPTKLLKIATFYKNDTCKWNTLILNHDGTPMQCLFQGPVIRLLAKGLGVTFNIVIPEDNKFGSLKPGGKSTGIVGMIERGEADLSVSGFTITERRLKAFPFTYPLYITDTTFMTNKFEQHPKSFAMFKVFSFEVWLLIGLCLIFVSLLLFFLLKKRIKFSTMLFESIGCLLENSFTFKARQRNTALLLLHLFIAFAILTASYKAVILSIITAPKMVGIQDISDLSEAVKENSIKCYTYKSSAGAREWLNYDRSKVIGECALKSHSEGFYGMQAFHKYPYKKAFLGERVEFRAYGIYYHVSDDSLRISFIGIPFSRNFCCPRKLETVVHRIVAAGLYEKVLKDESFTEKTRFLKEQEIVDDNTDVSPLKLNDLTGAFIVFFVGHLCALLAFIADILYKKWH